MKPKAIYILEPWAFDLVYGPDHRQRISELVDVCAPLEGANVMQKNPAILRDVEVIMSGWFAPMMDEAFLAAAPKLRAVFYGAGSVRGLVSDAFWDRGIVITMAASMNAIPVAEFTLSQILFWLKRGWQYVMDVKREQKFITQRHQMPGAYRTKVGIISLGEIGRRVAGLLKHFDVSVLAYDPFVSDAAFAELGVTRASLDEVFEQCDVVSLHAPNIPATQGMITGTHFRKMKENSTFINTAHGDIIRQSELMDVLRERTDIYAVLDVLANNDSDANSSIFGLPNLIVTPHIAGSMHGECRRMGQAMVDELQRYLQGQPLLYQVTKDRMALMA